MTTPLISGTRWIGGLSFAKRSQQISKRDFWVLTIFGVKRDKFLWAIFAAIWANFSSTAEQSSVWETKKRKVKGKASVGGYLK
ncbi:MAG: hypothetical protein GY820_34610 [Gammaproteobacteria bacterium]|nr:hypothetical protein [Gammaproteobacteria bacterium]